MENKEVIPFNLELARQGYSIETRDGRKARIVCFDYSENSSGRKKIIAIAEDKTNNREVLNIVWDNGKANPLDYGPDCSHCDLVMSRNIVKVPISDADKKHPREGWSKAFSEDYLYELYDIVDFLCEHKRISIKKAYKLHQIENIKKLTEKLLKYIK